MRAIKRIFVFLMLIVAFVASQTYSLALADNDTLVSIGLMSGTSMDGIDAALIRTDGQFRVEEIGHTSLDYAPEFDQLLKTAEYIVRLNKGNMEAAHRTNFLNALASLYDQKKN